MSSCGSLAIGSSSFEFILIVPGQPVQATPSPQIDSQSHVLENDNHKLS